MASANLPPLSDTTRGRSVGWVEGVWVGSVGWKDGCSVGKSVPNPLGYRLYTTTDSLFVVTRTWSLSDLRWVGIYEGNPPKYEMFFLSLGSRIYRMSGNTPNQFYRRGLSINLMEKKIWIKNIIFSWRNLKMEFFVPKIFFELRNFLSGFFDFFN